MCIYDIQNIYVHKKETDKEQHLQKRQNKGAEKPIFQFKLFALF